MRSIALLAALAAAFAASAAVRPGTPFSDGMVLQRDRAVPVWGTAEAGEKVSVEFAGQRKTAVADARGAWRVSLDPMPASDENRTMSIRGDGSSVEVRNVLVGEVWFASGQSNMECPIWGGSPRYRDGKGATMVQSTVRRSIRWAKNRKVCSAQPKPIEDTVWLDFSPEAFASAREPKLSAVAYYYALILHDALRVPVGIVDSSWGGTNIDAWTPRSGYENHPELKDVAAFPVSDTWDPANATGPVNRLHDQPTVLWNGMVAAWAPFATRGFIWYQGCNNNGEARRYCSKMHALYDGWAREFENPGLKLYFVELAPFKTNWFELQRAQMKFAAEEPNAAIAATCDVGNLDDIHPNDKETVARRLALHALKRDYGFANIRDDSPVLRTWSIEGRRFRLTFDNVDSWYVYAANRSVTPNFEIAGEDGKFVPAKLLEVDKVGNVKGRDLLVEAEGVEKPVRLRYLAKSPFAGTLYSEVALPLGPFDVDARPVPARRAGKPAKPGDAEKDPVLAGYRKVLSLDIAPMPKFASKPPAKVSAAGPVSRVAYLLELERDDGTVDWAITAMDAFSDDPARFGVPCCDGETIQKRVSGLQVRSNMASVKDVDGGEGVVEFWRHNYSPRRSLGIESASDAKYDIDDLPTPQDGPGYGSMQVHSLDGGVVWAFNNFNKGAVADIGIGPDPRGEHPDWTFSRNACDWRTRRLTVFVK